MAVVGIIQVNERTNGLSNHTNFVSNPVTCFKVFKDLTKWTRKLSNGKKLIWRLPYGWFSFKQHLMSEAQHPCKFAIT